MDTESPKTESSKDPQFEISTSRNFQEWLNGTHSSLLFSTYQIGKLFALGSNPDGTANVSERTFSRCMGLGVSRDQNTFWMSSLFQLWRFENSLLQGEFKTYDKVYLPQVAYTTGDLDIHDIILDANKRPIFVNTMFSCLATTSESHSFKSIWKPPFISALQPEDRCHLNGLAEKDGKPAYVTIVGTSDVADGWREHRSSRGIVMDVQTNEVVCTGLSMPHSPRWHNGKLYLLESGTGYFGYVDFETKSFKPVTFCPGFLRGLDFIDNHAIVGISGVRENKTFSGLKLDDNLKEANTQARCGLHIINVETGGVDHWVRLEGIVQELYDVKVLKNTAKPLLIGTKKAEIKSMISIES